MPTVSYNSWKQFLTWKKKMLAEYDRAKEQASTHPTQTHHGIQAQAQVRAWLSEFLPRRYGVTSGYIVSQRPPDQQSPITHFDVIIYDAQESPVLWIEDHPDASTAGAARGVPAEYTRAVFEVKSSFDATSAREALQKIEQLRPLLADEDAADERYKRFLPEGFFSAMVYFELRKDNERSEAALENIIPASDFRGFFGGVILRGEGLGERQAARLSLAQSFQPLEATIGPGGASLLSGFAMSTFRKIDNGNYIGALLQWSEAQFATFAFDLLALLNHTYRLGRISSFHALPIPEGFAGTHKGPSPSGA